MRFLHFSAFAGSVLTVLAAGPSLAQDFRPMSPVVCSSSDDVVIRNRVIETSGDGIVASGSCSVEIIDSRIIAGGVAVNASGSAEVHIRGSRVEGARGGLVASGSAEIAYRGCTIVGGTRASAHGEIIDLDGSTVGSSSTTGSQTVSVSGGTVNLGGITIDESGVALGDGTTIDSTGIRSSSGEDILISDDGDVSIGVGVVVSDDGNTVQVGGSDGVVVSDDGNNVSVAGDTVVITEEGDRVAVGVAGGTQVLVDGDFVRLHAGGSTVDVQGSWRESTGFADSDTDRLLVELGARSEAGQTQLDLSGDILFDFNSTAIRTDAATQLAKLAHILKKRAGAEILVIGHTDSIGSDEANQKLSVARAVSVMRWLNSREKIPAKVMRGRGMGAKEPIAHNTKPDGSDDPTGRAKNRRVEIRF